MKQGLYNTYNLIATYPFLNVINPYYLDKPKKLVFSLTNINKLFFPNKNNVNFHKLMLTPSSLYSVSYPYEAQLITDTILKYVSENNIIVDANANVGGNTINFAFKFANVISIELDTFVYSALKNNIGEYHLNNVTAYNMDCLSFLYNTDNIFDIVFFDPPWGGVLVNLDKTNKIELVLNDTPLDTIIYKLLKQKRRNKLKIFMKVPANYTSKLKHKIIRIKNYHLHYYNN
jgi:16S rRNA G966 N2-methylase RsmD